MKVSKDGIEHIKSFEGLVLHAYDDFDPRHLPVKPGDKVRGTLTIGYGHTGPDVKPGLVITEQEAEELLRRDLEFPEAAVNRYVTVKLRQNQFDALVDFAFNAGVGNFKRSTLLRKLNAGDDYGAAMEFMRWVYSKGEKLLGLIRRRKAEQQMFLGGSRPPVTSPPPPPSVA